MAQWVKESSVAVGAAQIYSLAQEFSYAMGVAVKKKKGKKKKKVLRQLHFIFYVYILP